MKNKNYELIRSIEKKYKSLIYINKILQCKTIKIFILFIPNAIYW